VLVVSCRRVLQDELAVVIVIVVRVVPGLEIDVAALVCRTGVMTERSLAVEANLGRSGPI